MENVSNYTVEIGNGIQVSMAVQVRKYLTFFSIKCIMAINGARHCSFSAEPSQKAVYMEGMSEVFFPKYVS
jgi:hypothetical protein